MRRFRPSLEILQVRNGAIGHFEVSRALAGLLYKRLKVFAPVDTRNLKEWFDSKRSVKEMEDTRNIEAGTIAAL